jgi:hypothetical protein
MRTLSATRRRYCSPTSGDLFGPDQPTRIKDCRRVTFSSLPAASSCASAAARASASVIRASLASASDAAPENFATRNRAQTPEETRPPEIDRPALNKARRRRCFRYFFL